MLPLLQFSARWAWTSIDLVSLSDAQAAPAQASLLSLSLFPDFRCRTAHIV
jgi:hypothetical protein